MARRGRAGGRAVRWRGGSLGPTIVVGGLLLLVAVLSGSGALGGKPSAPPRATSPADAGGPAGGGTAATPSEPPVVTSRGVWYSEISYGQWIAGEVGPGRRVRFPALAVPLAGGSGLVVTGVNSPSSTSLAVWDLATGTTIQEVVVSFNVMGAAVAADGSTVYLAGVTRAQTIDDAGVSALSLESGQLSQLVAPLPLRPEWEGNAARGLVIGSDGKVLATALCGAPAGSEDSSCEISAIDLASGAVVGSVTTSGLYLAAVTDDSIVTRNRSTLVAYGFDGSERWRLVATDIRGPVAEAAGNVIVAYAPVGSVSPARVATVSPGGAVTDLIVAEGENELTVWPPASDSSTVIVANGPPMEFAFGTADRVMVSAIDAATGRVARDAVTITPGGQP